MTTAEDMGDVVDELIEKKEEANKVQDVPLTEVEKLTVENIQLKRVLLKQQMDQLQKELGLLAENIKHRVGASDNMAVAFDPGNPAMVRIGLPNGESS